MKEMGVHFALPDSDLQSICFQGKHLCFCAQWQCKDWRTRKRLNKRRTKNRDSSAVSVSARSLIVIRTHQKLNGFVTVTVTSRAFAFNWRISAVDSIAVSVLPSQYCLLYRAQWQWECKDWRTRKRLNKINKNRDTSVVWVAGASSSPLDHDRRI